VVAGASLLLAILAVLGVRRSRRATAIAREAEARHEEKLAEFEARKREKEAAHAAQMQAHLESVKRAQDAVTKQAPQEPMVCPSCRREYPPGSTFCPADANRLIPLAGHEMGPAGAICPTSKRGFNPGVSRCPHDGAELVPYAMMRALAPAPAVTKGKICPTCGGRFDGTAGFCGKDGTALVLLN